MGLIQNIAALAPANSQHPPAPRTRTHTFGLRIPGVSPSTNGNHRLDVPRYLQAHGIDFAFQLMENTASHQPSHHHAPAQYRKQSRRPAIAGILADSVRGFGPVW